MVIVLILLLIPNFFFGQKDTMVDKLGEVQTMLRQAEAIRIADSLKKVELNAQLLQMKSSEISARAGILAQFKTLEAKDSLRKVDMVARVQQLKKNAVGFPVTLYEDTLFTIYTKIGSITAKERAAIVTKRIKTIYNDNSGLLDSLMVINSDNTVDVGYGDVVIISVSDFDAIWNNTTKIALANDYKEKIKAAVVAEKKKHSVVTLLVRIGLVLLVLSGILLVMWLINKGYIKAERIIVEKKNTWLKDLSYKGYTFVTADQELHLAVMIIKLFKWFMFILLLYLFLPLIFSIFPFTQGWATVLFDLIWSPFRDVLLSVWHFIPNLFTILVIYFVIKYVVKFVKYLFSEIEAEKLTISGFHADWAMPTFGIVRFLLYAFMFVLIFPYLPGSDSNVFKGVSVFLGVLFSLGSSSAIGNMVAGLVITYMRPFKIGDRIKIGDITGDVIEKTMLVTRIRTIKNEEITIPNSSVLSGNTTNYSTNANTQGLIVHTTVTIGYDVPWKDMHQALIDAALKTEFIMPDPKPFVLQTSLDDFYVSYQINAYTREASKQAVIYSNLHQNIQDICNERGIEILSPHYRAARDGNNITIPAGYLPKDYKAPTFGITISKDEGK
jgi:Small-conductance mechanosensitive channel